jgi:lipopolysaccharide export system permease protein
VSYLDRIVLVRLASRIGLAMAIFFGLIVLVESIDPWRFNYLLGVGGLPLALLGLCVAAAQWLLRSLPLVVLVGAVIGITDLQGRRELTALKASGASIWRIMLAPAIALALFGLAITFVGEGLVTATNRALDASLPGDNGGLSSAGLWLEQNDGSERYLLHAEHVVANGQQLQDVAIYLPDGLTEGRILGPSATLANGNWNLPTATRFRAGQAAETLTDFPQPTSMTPADLHLKLDSPDDMTFSELAASLGDHVSDTSLRNAVVTRFARLLTLPALLVGSLFIAFAFTAGYRRTNGYGVPVVYAILTGFVVFVVSEMADRAGSAGVLEPIFAASGPAFVAIIVGLTVLMYKEDGWA